MHSQSSESLNISATSITTASLPNSPSFGSVPINLDTSNNNNSLTQTLNSGKTLLNKLIKSNQLLSPIEKENFPKIINITTKTNLTNMTNDLLTPESSQNGNDVSISQTQTQINEREIINTVYSLVTSLDLALKQIQQLKYKSMIHDTTNNDDIQSRIDVEKNLQKIEFERIKTQLLTEKKILLDRVITNENKVKKYKKRIVDKNIEINKLTKVLNGSLSDGTFHDTSLEFSNSSISSFSRPIRKLGAPTISIITTPTGPNKKLTTENSGSKKSSNMLRTLGALASHVLKTNDDNEDTSINRTVLIQNSKIEDDNNTEAEISFPLNNRDQHNNHTRESKNDNNNTIITEDNSSRNTNNILDNNNSPTIADSTSTPTAKAQRNLNVNLPNNINNDNNHLNITTKINQVQGLSSTVQPNKTNLINHQNVNDTLQTVSLPRMRSFNTIDGTIKN